MVPVNKQMRPSVLKVTQHFYVEGTDEPYTPYFFKAHKKQLKEAETMY